MTTIATTATTTAPETELATLQLRGAHDDETWQAKAEKERKDAQASGTAYKYQRFLPFFDPELRLPPLEPFEHKDPGHEAKKHANPRSFLEGGKATTITPKFGSEVEGIQLSQLDAKGRQQLALYVAERGVVAFRDQDFIDQPPEWQLNDWGAFFGRLHIHPCSGAPQEFPELHLVYRDAIKSFNFEQRENLSTSIWHSDVTYEEQPPGLTTLWLYESPESGGDTVYASQTEAYNRLSPSFRSYLETLSVLHSGVQQAEFSRGGNRGGIVKREPVENVHPLVRRHPVTGQKALFINRQFSRHIVGLKKQESDAILGLLYDHIEKGVDFQARVKWQPRTVVLWDNRVSAHSAIIDFDEANASRRHGARITPQAERPSL